MAADGTEFSRQTRFNSFCAFRTVPLITSKASNCTSPLYVSDAHFELPLAGVFVPDKGGQSFQNKSPEVLKDPAGRIRLLKKSELKMHFVKSVIVLLLCCFVEAVLCLLCEVFCNVILKSPI